MTPHVLNQITPALEPASSATDKPFLELGVEIRQKRHARVKATADVRTLAAHLIKSHALDCGQD